MKSFSKTPFYKEAYEKARKEEAALLPHLQSHFNDPDLKQTEETFNKFDFVSAHRKIELKSRACLLFTYQKMMIGANKIREAQKCYCERDYIFVFKFENGAVYFWKFDPTVELEFLIGGRTDRGRDERSEYCFIPSVSLKYLMNI